MYKNNFAKKSKGSLIKITGSSCFAKRLCWAVGRTFWTFCWILLCVSCFLFQWFGLLFPFSVFFLVQSKNSKMFLATQITFSKIVWFLVHHSITTTSSSSLIADYRDVIWNLLKFAGQLFFYFLSTHYSWDGTNFFAKLANLNSVLQS